MGAHAPTTRGDERSEYVTFKAPCSHVLDGVSRAPCTVNAVVRFHRLSGMWGRGTQLAHRLRPSKGLVGALSWRCLDVEPRNSAKRLGFSEREHVSVITLLC